MCEKQHSLKHPPHLTDGNDVRCFIAVNELANDGKLQ